MSSVHFVHHVLELLCICFGSALGIIIVVLFLGWRDLIYFGNMFYMTFKINTHSKTQTHY